MKTTLNKKEMDNLLKRFGLSDKEINITLKDEILNTMDKYYNEQQEHEQKKESLLGYLKSAITI